MEPITYQPLLGIARNFLDVRSGGVGSQVKLLEHLTGENPINYQPEAPDYAPTRTFVAESTCNLLGNPVVSRTLDPSLFDGANEKVNEAMPPEFFGTYCDWLRTLNGQHTDNVRRGRSYALRCISGMPAYLGQNPISAEEAARISDSLNLLGYRTRGKNFTSEVLTDFVTGNQGVIDGLEQPLVDHWNGRGRRERVRTHTGKLRLMNAIMGVTLDMANETGVDLFETPNMNGRRLYEDEYIVSGWGALGEHTPSPSALLETSRQAVSRAGRYLMFSGIATAAERMSYNLKRRGK